VFLLDTNVLIWLVTDSPRLSRSVRRRLEPRARSTIGISVLSIWELGVAVAGRRVRIKGELGAMSWCRADWSSIP
jgi:PIN domain nuclease of toxin-antitoxin system